MCGAMPDSVRPVSYSQLQSPMHNSVLSITFILPENIPAILPPCLILTLASASCHGDQIQAGNGEQVTYITVNISYSACILGNRSWFIVDNHVGSWSVHNSSSIPNYLYYHNIKHQYHKFWVGCPKPNYWIIISIIFSNCCLLNAILFQYCVSEITNLQFTVSPTHTLMYMC